MLRAGLACAEKIAERLYRLLSFSQIRSCLVREKERSISLTRTGWRRAIRARLEKLEGSAPAEMSRCGEIVRSVLGTADRERSQACGSLLPVYYQSRETAVCRFS